MVQHMDLRYLEISGKYHLPQIPAEGRPTCPVVRSLPLYSIRKREREGEPGNEKYFQLMGFSDSPGLAKWCRMPQLYLVGGFLVNG